MNEPFSLNDADLSALFMPAWAKENGEQHSFRSSSDKEEKKERRPFERKNRMRRNFSSEAPVARKIEPPRPIEIVGWKVELLPEARGMDEMAKQVRKEMKAYSLFDLARLVLEKPQRYHVKWSQRRGEENKSTALFQCSLDDTLWLSEKEVLKHAFSQHHTQFYRSEKVTTEPPKGSYTAVGVCGISQTLLGPPNHHEYQSNIRRLHAERFSRMSFEVFKNRIQVTRDEALLERWKEEQSTQEVFYLLASVNDEAESKIGSRVEAEEHFKKTHAASVVKKVETEIVLTRASAWQQAALPVRRFVEQEIESLKRFPLTFSQELGQALATRGLHLFKAHENIVYVSIARPRPFYKDEQAFSDSVKQLLTTLKAHANVPRAQQWKILLETHDLGKTPQEYEASLLKDLSWLLHEGYVVNFATRGFSCY